MRAQAALDVDGSRAVSEDEFLAMAREYLEVERMPVEGAEEEVGGGGVWSCVGGWVGGGARWEAGRRQGADGRVCGSL
jgi:hypothetical protein